MKRANDFLASYVHTSLSKFFLEKMLDTEWHSVPGAESRGDPAKTREQWTTPPLPPPPAGYDRTRYSKLTGRLPIITAADTARQNFTSTHIQRAYTTVGQRVSIQQFFEWTRRRRRLLAAPVNGHLSLSLCLRFYP